MGRVNCCKKGFQGTDANVADQRVNEEEVLAMIDGAKKVMLVEPNYRRKYPPLGLCKIGARAKANGAEVRFGRRYDRWEGCDLICVTSLFTYYSHEVRNVLKVCTDLAPDVPTVVGGISASLMPGKTVAEFPEVKVFVGYSEELDGQVPDFSLVDDVEPPWNEDFSYVFTSRGCPNHCAYCAVPRIEPEPRVYRGWKDHVLADRGSVMVSDNNLSACPEDHIDDVLGGLVEMGKKAVFDNGFDCKHITPAFAAKLARLKYDRSGLRMAFDRIDEDGTFQDAVRMLLKAGVASTDTMAYVLFNFNDTPKEAYYRARECWNLGVRPYLQRYAPLSWTNPKKRFVGKHWSDRLAVAFRGYWLLAGYYTKMTFDKYLRDEAPWRHKVKDEDLAKWHDCPEVGA